MKKIYFIIVALLTSNLILAQTISKTKSFVSNDYIERHTDIPIVRNINGGTVFNITYLGDWNLEMRGAFEYACKIWEEQLPPSLPINITVGIGDAEDDTELETLSSLVLPRGQVYTMGLSAGKYSYSTRVKGVLQKELNNRNFIQYFDEITDSTFFKTPDITILYNPEILKECSFSLYSTPTDKYDFVSLVLRDIARGLGIQSRFLKYPNSNRLMNSYNEPLSSFEEHIVTALNTSDVYEAFERATKGSLSINITDYGSITLYAPSTWIDYTSLNFFIPNQNEKRGVVNLLSHEFGRGSVTRDITDSSIGGLFANGLGWKTYLATGADGTPSASENGSTGNVIPFGGQISSSRDGNTRTIAINSVDDSNYMANKSIFRMATDENDDFDLYGILLPYHHFYNPKDDNNLDLDGWTVSILKKDGTWDMVYEQSYWFDLNINMTDCEFHYDNDMYSRTCDGYLRCRITKSYMDYDYFRPKRIYEAEFIVVDYLPQKAELQFEKVIGPTEINMMRSMQQDYDEYLRDIKIDIKNLEGVESVMVEQLIEGDRIPTKFEVEDFKKGYFTATIDKEFYSWFTVVTTNKNGSVRSETLEIAPLEPATDTAYGFDVNVTDDVVSISGNSKRLYERNCLQSYRIEPINRLGSMTGLAGEITDNHVDIDVSGLANGVYVLLYTDTNGRQYSYKFVKR